MSEPTLRKCPFCNSAPELFGGHDDVWFVNHKPNCGIYGKTYMNVDDLKYWNTRPNEDALVAALRTLVGMYVANKGSETSEFIACITPPHDQNMTRKERAANPTWKAWDAAIALLAQQEASK